MRPLIRIAFAIIFLCFTALNLFAGTGSVKPVRAVTIQFDQIMELNTMLSTSLTVLTNKKSGPDSVESAESGGRICSCQILDLESSNYNHQHVVLLAEKTNNGNSSDYYIARNRIQKEKKHLRTMFYDKVKLVSETEGTGSCKSMYFRLKTADSLLQLYEILNADIY